MTTAVLMHGSCRFPDIRPAPTALRQGLLLEVKATVANTGASRDRQKDSPMQREILPPESTVGKLGSGQVSRFNIVWRTFSKPTLEM